MGKVLKFKAKGVKEGVKEDVEVAAKTLKEGFSEKDIDKIKRDLDRDLQGTP